eukprot:g22530.t1
MFSLLSKRFTLSVKIVPLKLQPALSRSRVCGKQYLTTAEFTHSLQCLFCFKDPMADESSCPRSGQSDNNNSNDLSAQQASANATYATSAARALASPPITPLRLRREQRQPPGTWPAGQKLVFPPSPSKKKSPQSQSVSPSRDRYIPVRGGETCQAARQLYASETTPFTPPYQQEFNDALAKALFSGNTLASKILDFDVAAGNCARQQGATPPQTCSGWGSPVHSPTNATTHQSFDEDSLSCSSPSSPLQPPYSPNPSSPPHADTVAMETHQSDLRTRYDHNLRVQRHRFRRSKERKQPKLVRILDAPDIVDDYYLNVLTWSCNNLIAIGLGTQVWVWNADTAQTTLLTDNTTDSNTPGARLGNFVTSLRWSKDGKELAVGNSQQTVQIWDIKMLKLVRSMQGHSGRVSSLCWGSSDLLSSGSRDSLILHHDVRAAAHRVATLQSHSEEVCGLEWSPDSRHLASGGNDNLCCVWDGRKSCTSNTLPAARGYCSPRPLQVFPDHCAAVKALAWCPWQPSILATGGGTADRCIRIFDTVNGKCTAGVDTKSQVCSLLWSRHSKELVSAHGYNDNQLILWSFPKLKQTTQLTGHSSRILHASLSPDGNVVCTAGADETIRFWDVWNSPPEPPRSKQMFDVAAIR